MLGFPGIFRLNAIPQLPDRGRRHKAPPQQPMLQQLRQPGGIGHIGLAARQDLDVPGVDQQQLQPALLQHIPARLPVLAGRLHHHLGDPVLGEPVGKGLKPRAERLEGAQLLAASPGAIGHAHAGHHLVLADVQPGAALVDHLHRRHLPRPLGGARRGQPIRRR